MVKKYKGNDPINHHTADRQKRSVCVFSMKAYKDPTADIAIRNVSREERKPYKAPKHGEVSRERETKGSGIRVNRGEWFYSQMLREMKDFNSAKKTVGGNEGEKCLHRTRLDTYGCGCAHDCSYCYAKSLLKFRNLWNPANPSVGDISKIASDIKKLPRGEVVRLGGMTDCFQPAERLHKVTYKTIRLLNKAKVPYLIVTKSAMVAEYADVMNKDLAHIQITVTTLDDALCATYEKASPPSERVKAILALQERGFDVQLRLSPFIPEYVDTDALNALGIDKICIEFLRANTWIRKWFKIDYSDYMVRHGGYLHLPLEKKLEYIKGITGFKEMTVCEDEDRAYQYWRENFNHNKDDCCNLRRLECS